MTSPYPWDELKRQREMLEEKQRAERQAQLSRTIMYYRKAGEHSRLQLGLSIAGAIMWIAAALGLAVAVSLPEDLKIPIMLGAFVMGAFAAVTSAFAGYHGKEASVYNVKAVRAAKQAAWTNMTRDDS